MTRRSQRLSAGRTRSSTDAHAQSADGRKGKRKLNTQEGSSNTTSEQQSSKDRIILGLSEAALQEMISAAVAKALQTAQPAYGTSTRRQDDSTSTPIEGNDDAVNKKRKGCKYKHYLACKPPIFNGEKGAIAAYTWLQKIETVFKLCDCADDEKVRYAVCSSFESGAAWSWWRMYRQGKGEEEIDNLTWDEFKELVLKDFCSGYQVDKVEEEFMRLEMGNNYKTLTEYTTKFKELAYFIPQLATPETSKINRYISGLPFELATSVIVSGPKTLEEAVTHTRAVERFSLV